MRHKPELSDFLQLAKQLRLVPVYRQLVGDTLTPVTAFRKIQTPPTPDLSRGGKGWSFLFESVIGGERVGRYSFLGSGPFLRFQAHDRRVRIESELGERCTEELHSPDPLKLLEDRLHAYRAPHVSGLPRFCGGAVGYA